MVEMVEKSKDMGDLKLPEKEQQRIQRDDIRQLK